jgi:hypothetical protein
MANFASIKEYIARFKNLKADIITSGGKEKSDSEYVSIVLNNLSPAFKNFAIIFYNIPLFIKAPVSPSLEDVFSNLIQASSHLEEFGRTTPCDQAHSKATHPHASMSLQGKLPNPPRRRGWCALIAIRRDIPSKLVSFIFKRLKILLGKQLATMTSLKKRLVLLNSTHLAVHFALWSSTSSQEWIADSGATRHMMKHKHLLSNYSDQHKGEKVTIGDDSTLPVFGCGTVVVDNAKFGDVLHVLGVGPNLLSIYCITHTNKKVEFWLDRWVVKDISDKFKVVAFGYCDESKCMYKLGKVLHLQAQNKFIAMVANADDDSMLWHFV